MPHRIGLAIASLHISAALYALIAGLFVILCCQSDVDLPITILMGGFCLALTLGLELIVLGLRRRRFWAWLVGLCVFAIYVPSLFLPLGALGLWGLLDPGSRLAFGVGQPRNRNELSEVYDE